MNTQSETPLYSALTAWAAESKLRMHMPGHKGKALLLPPGFGPVAALDATELPDTGNLYEGVPPISGAEELAAAAFGAEQCFFLTGGSTQGLMAALSLCCLPGSRLLLDRGCHRSVYNAMALLDLQPEYLLPEYLPLFHISAGITPGQVRAALRRYPDTKAVCVTSPTYYGVLSDIPALAAAAHEFGAALVVDEAHGAHLPFLLNRPCAQGQGADLSVASAHKTLPALGQGAFLFASRAFAPERVRSATALFGTSSPSYPIMASLDWARASMAGAGGEAYRETARRTAELREWLNRESPFAALDEETSPRQSLGRRLDPTRLVIQTAAAGPSGYEAARLLEEKWGISCEMADAANVVLILTAADANAELSHLRRGLAGLIGEIDGESGSSSFGTPPLPRRVLSPRQALLAPRKFLPLREAAGRTAAESVAPYPPGIPVVAPGEEISEKILAYLFGIGYNIDTVKAVVPQD